MQERYLTPPAYTQYQYPPSQSHHQQEELTASTYPSRSYPSAHYQPPTRPLFPEGPKLQSTSDLYQSYAPPPVRAFAPLRPIAQRPSSQPQNRAPLSGYLSKSHSFPVPPNANSIRENDQHLLPGGGISRFQSDQEGSYPSSQQNRTKSGQSGGLRTFPQITSEREEENYFGDEDESFEAALETLGDGELFCVQECP